MTESEFRGAVASWFIRGERSVMDCERWMRGTGFSSAMAAMGCDRETARRALALLYIHRERNDILDDDQPLDKVLGRLVAGLAQRLEEGETMERIVGAVARAKPVFQAWKARDKSTVIHFLADEAVRKRLQGADDASETMAMLKAIAGDEVHASVEARCRRAVDVFENGTRVTTMEGLQQTVAQTVERAFWDAAREKVVAGDIEPIFDTLTHAKDCVDALLGNAPTTREQFDDRFDVQWIRQRADRGTLSRQDVANLCVYLAEQVGRMQAPADDAEVQPWVAAVRQEAEEESSLTDYLPSVLFVVRDAIHHLRKVYQRLKRE